jgi:lipopolysaccharide export system permease protein
MIKKLDIYIVKKFLGTFFFSIALIISIAIVFDFSENVDEFIEKKAPTEAIIFQYYLNFIPHFANLFSPLFIFITVIYFTSRMASNTEIIAILASGISFRRFLRPYLISSIFLAILSFYLNNFLIPESNKVRLDFRYTYIKNQVNNRQRDIHFQLKPNNYAYLESYSVLTDVGINFSLERFDDSGKLRYKLQSDFIKWDSTKQKWQIQNYYERYINGNSEHIKRGLNKDTVLNMLPEDFVIRDEEVEMLNYYELNQKIADEEFQGDKYSVWYKIEKYKRQAFPFASIILTFIGVAIASRKVRGGIGLHLAFGLGLSFTYILFMKVTQTFSTNGSLDPAIAMWIPNVVFGFIAIFLISRSAK